MSSVSTHIIDSLQIELDINRADQADVIQNEVSRLVTSELVPELERIFGPASGEDHLVIERLELDIGRIDPDRLSAMLVKQIVSGMEEQLSLLSIGAERGRKTLIHSYTQKALSKEILFHFLKTGSLPWFAGISPQEVTIANLFDEALLFDVQSVREFISKNYTTIYLRNRLIYYIPDVIRKLLDLFVPDISAKAESFIYFLSAELGLKPKENRIFEALIETGMAVGDTSDIVLFGVELMRRIHPGAQQPEDREADEPGYHFSDRYYPLEAGEIKDITRIYFTIIRSPSAANKPFSDSAGYVTLSGAVLQYLSAFSDRPAFRSLVSQIMQGAEARRGKIDSSRWKAFLKLLQDDLSEETKPASPEISEQGFDDEKPEEYYIQNAGLILLWPFLTRFFKNQELIAEQQFIDEPARYKAMHLLQYIAAGDYPAPEHVLLLNKLLCGHPFEEPVPIDIKLLPGELKEADELIASIIRYWEVLKNTSIEGFRGSFLMRNGKLRRQESGWELLVELKAYDMLLDKLPWGISTVKLPWMNILLHVEWR